MFSGTTTGAPHLKRKQSTSLPRLSNVQATMQDSVCEEEQHSSVTTSGKDGNQMDPLALSVAEIIAQMNAEDDDYFSFIPWRKHLLGKENAEHSIQGKTVPEGELSKNWGGPRENWEEPSLHKNMAVTERNLATASDRVDAALENITARLNEFKQTMEQASDNVQVFKEASVTFKECCDNMCRSMSSLQGVLEILIQILRE